MKSSLEPYFGKYDIVYIDPPWAYYGDPNKNAAAGKHYSLMSLDEIKVLPILQLARDKKHFAVFVWATSPRLHDAIDAIRAWGLFFRGTPFVWVKTNKEGKPVNGQGIPPTSTKPITEFVLLGTTSEKGRPFPLLDAAVPQVIFARRGLHSEKPDIIRQHIVSLYGDRPRLEMFSRHSPEGWDTWGNEVGKLS